MYHDVVPAARRDSSGFTGPGPDRYKLAPELFSAHLDAIAAAGLQASLVDQPAGRPALHLTFDDGGSSATEAGRILEGRRLSGHFFVTTARIGSPGFLGRDGIVALREAGHIVGSHSHTHAALSRLTDAETATEWETSRRILEDVLGEPVTTASVPGGFYSPRVAELAAAAGFRHLFTSEPGVDTLRMGILAVHGRFAVVERTSVSDIAALCSLSRPALLRAAVSWTARKTARAALGPLYAEIRRRLLSRR